MIYSDKDFILGMQQGFIECAEWADGESIKEYDENTTYETGNGFSVEAVKSIDKTVKQFYKANRKLLRNSGLSPDQCGHDFYLTAQGHGAGFWDRGIGEIGDKLTIACKGHSWDIWANENGLLEI